MSDTSRLHDKMQPLGKIDVLITVGERDINRLFRLSLNSCIKNLDLLNDIFIVTNSKVQVIECLKTIDLKCRNITVFQDSEVLPPDLNSLPGWFRQQLIKLHADQIAKTRLIACLGADTVILKKVQPQDIVFEGRPIHYYNRDPQWPGFLQYERGRVANVAKILCVKPVRSLPFGDFIMDFSVLSAEYLIKLRKYLSQLYGVNPFIKIIPSGYPITPLMKKSFGEWTLYSVFILDVLNLNLAVRNSNSQFLAQVQNEAGLRKYGFNSKIVHFVKKTFDLDYIKSRLAEFELC